MRAEFDPAHLRGTVILVHIANPPSFTQRTVYRGPWDQTNLKWAIALRDMRRPFEELLWEDLS